MDAASFETSVADGTMPPGLAPGLRALWMEARGDWDAAHRIVQEESDADAAWVHAYLHRREGDLDNARYWYRRAGREPATDDLAAEWRRIAAALLAADT